MKQPHSLLTSAQKRKATDSLIAYFLDERGEEIGVIAAEDLLDMMLGSLRKPVYSKAVSDVMKLVEVKYSDLQIDASALTDDWKTLLYLSKIDCYSAVQILIFVELAGS
jgi:uncharacterized protein (DUF2164 family)